MLWYYNFLAQRPYLMILGLTTLSLTCIIVSLTINALPDFSDPTMGFETRGTDIAKRLNAWRNLKQETGPSGMLVADPNDLRFREKFTEAAISSLRPFVRKHKNRKHNRKRNKNKKHQKNKKNRKNKNDISTLVTDKPVFGGKRDFHDSFDEDLNITTDWNGEVGIFHDYEITNGTLTSSQEQQQAVNRSFEYGRNTTFMDEDDHLEKLQTRKSTWDSLKKASFPTSFEDDTVHIPQDDYFCGSPLKEFSHFVVERIGPNATDSIFTLNGLLGLCQLQEQITQVNTYEEYCETNVESHTCCRPWSLASYLSLLVNKTSCFDLTLADVNMLENLLTKCFKYYHDFKFSSDCGENTRCYAPTECETHNAVFNIFHYLADYNFIKINSSKVYLKYAMIFVPVPHTYKILPLFHEWEKVELKNDILQVVAMDLGLENELFKELLLSDVWLVSLGGFFVMACIWLYTTSMFVTVMTCLAVIFCLGLAYFIYTIVFEMAFFPYMNLLAVVVIIGIGADNAFLFVKIWQCVLAERFAKSSTVTTQSLTTVETIEYTESLQNLMALTLRHVAPSMIVSSMTTAVAFYASYVSSITSIKCFGVFAGTAVITNVFLMVTWLPASVSIMERLSSCKTCNKLQVQKLLLMIHKSINRFCKVFETTIISIVMKYAIYWVVIFAIIGCCSIFIVLCYPGLQLPENSNFQLFVSKHPFQKYNSKLKYEFWFERLPVDYEHFKLPLRFVWGIQPVDDGDYTNPYVHGNLYLDNNFNITTQAAQTWLYDFCRKIEGEPFYKSTPGFQMIVPNCFIDIFKRLMERKCIDGMDNTDRTPCCEVSKFPYEPHVFEECLPEIMSSLHKTPRDYYLPGDAGPKFMASPTEHTEILDSNENLTDWQKHSNVPSAVTKAIVLEFESNVSIATPYGNMKEFVTSIEKWFNEVLETAPDEMKNGWFITELKFFDVQDNLAHGTIIAIIVAMTASSTVMLVATLNVLVSFYAIITVSFTIFTTMAILILLDWRLNVLESVTVSSAIGLAVDFSLHYGIHYRLSPTCERLAATQFSMSRILGPTAMAAITTGFAGVFMLASNVLPYIQIGIFLCVVMTVSWSYGTFFLMSLLKLAGPQYGFMQFSYPKIIKKRSNTNGIKYYDRKQSTVVASEQLLTPSNSGVPDLLNSETHELESLTSGHLIKTISGATSSRAPTSISASVSPTASPHYDHTTFHNLVDNNCLKAATDSLLRAEVKLSNQ